MNVDSMDDLIITVAADSNVSWPTNPYCPSLDDTETDEFIEEMAEEYVEAIDAGASIAHIHGVRELESEVQADGKQMSRLDLDGWKRMHERILDGSDAIMQYGVASARLDDKIEQMKLQPDMMAYAFNAHDEYFNPVWEDEHDPNEMYGIHTRDELRDFLIASNDHGVKPEVEAFHTGAFFNVRQLRQEGLFEDPIWITLFVGWPGGAWTPPTPRSLLNFVEHLPENVNWNVSCMDPTHAWDVLTMAIMLGGHVRVGWEDNPYLTPEIAEKNVARTNATLVEKIARIATELGRDVATPERAREIIGLG